MDKMAVAARREILQVMAKVISNSTNHLLLVFAEMALVYANDWFVVPEMPVNSLCQVLKLVVTPVFQVGAKRGYCGCSIKDCRQM